MEPSKEFIEEIKLKDLNVKNGFGEDLPFKDKTFDIIISKYAIQTSTQAKECLLQTKEKARLSPHSFSIGVSSWLGYGTCIINLYAPQNIHIVEETQQGS